jgi:hypothetical protein
MVPEQKIGVVLLMNTNDPAIDSAFASVGWDVLLIQLGKKPRYYPPWENFIRQHGRSIFVVVNILLLASSIWFLRKSRSLRQSATAGAPTGASRWKMILGYIVIPLVVDLFLAWFLLAIQLPDASATVLVVLRMAPDLGLLISLTLFFTLGWGPLRTLLMLRAIFRRAPGKEASSEQQWNLGPAA